MRTLFVLVALMVGGCANVSRDAGFADVQKLTGERGVASLRWNQQNADDKAAKAAVARILAGELTADQAVQIALLNNPRLQATYEELSIAQADLVQAGLLKNPVFDGDFRLREGGGGLSFEGSIVTNFIDLLLIPLRKRLAEAEFQAAKFRVSGEVLQLAGQARSAFYRVIADQQLLEMRQTAAESLAASVEVVRRLRQAGNITQLALSAQQAQYEEARADLIAAQGEAQQSHEKLNALMGLWGKQVEWKTSARLAEVPPTELDVENAERRAVQNSLSLLTKRQELIASAQRLGLSQPMATLLDAQVGVSAERSPEEGWAVGPSVSLPIPLFDQGQARVAKAQAQLRQAMRLYTADAIGIRAQARAAAIRLRAARARVEQLKNVVLPLRQQVVRETQLQYNAMQVGVVQLLDAKREQIEAGARYIEALRDYWLARSELEQITHGVMPDRTGGSHE